MTSELCSMSCALRPLLHPNSPRLWTAFTQPFKGPFKTPLNGVFKTLLKPCLRWMRTAPRTGAVPSRPLTVTLSCRPSSVPGLTG